MGKVSSKVNIEGFAAEISSILSDYYFTASNTFRRIVDETAEQTATEIRNNAPERSGIYSNSWTSGYEKNKGSMYSKIVYADKDGYRIAHLLEHGHAKRNGGRVAAITHIAPAEANAEREIIKRIRELM